MILHTFTLKAAPVGADEVYIASAADGFGERRATLTSLLTSQTLTTCTLDGCSATGTLAAALITATKYNGVSVSTATGTTVLTLASGSSLITAGANSLTLTTTGATNVTLPLTGTLATLAGVETFTNKTFTAPNFSNAVLVTPNIGVATATSINGVTITASTGVLALVSGSSLITAGAFALTLTTTATSNVTVPAGSSTMARTDDANTFNGVQTMTSAVLITPGIGVATGTSLAVTGLLTSSSPTAGIGYATGAGGAVTQITSRTTSVTMVPNPCLCGVITTDAASLAARVPTTFTVTNSAVAARDVVLLAKVSGDVDTFAWVNSVGAGNFTVTLYNSHNADADTTAFVFNFIIIKAVNA